MNVSYVHSDMYHPCRTGQAKSELGVNVLWFKLPEDNLKQGKYCSSLQTRDGNISQMNPSHEIHLSLTRADSSHACQWLRQTFGSESTDSGTTMDFGDSSHPDMAYGCYLCHWCSCSTSMSLRRPHVLIWKPGVHLCNQQQDMWCSMSRQRECCGERKMVNFGLFGIWKLGCKSLLEK